LIDEEVAELKEASESQDRVEQLDALIDILVVTAGALHSLGVNAEGAWKEVMRSNFDKIDSITGRVKKREDGKVLKPENWEPPRLAKFVRSE
jgi:predicted HAD superfamily Cof-like phosphohydrolase